MRKKDVWIACRIEDELKMQIELIAIALGMSTSASLRVAIKEYVAKRQGVAN
jgi:predicted transcriptional regulator